MFEHLKTLPTLGSDPVSPRDWSQKSLQTKIFCMWLTATAQYLDPPKGGREPQKPAPRWDIVNIKNSWMNSSKRYSDIQIFNLSSVFACLFGRKLWVFISTNHLTSTSLGMSFHVLPHFCDVWGQHGCVCFLHIGCQEVGRRVVCLVKRRLGRSETYIKSNAGNSAEILILESVWCLKNTLVPKNPSCITFPCFESHPVVRFWVPSRR